MESSSFVRFNLVRRFDECPAITPGRRLLFVMLNPSTATDTEDDPTIRRCKSFGMREGCEYIEVINLFAWRATKPSPELYDQPDKPNNFEIEAWRNALEREPWRIIAAWGDPSLLWLKRKVRTRVPFLLEALNVHGRYMHSLALTKSGMPRHPLYLPGSSVLEPWLYPDER